MDTVERRWITNRFSIAQAALALLAFLLLATPVLAQGGGPTMSVSGGFDGYCRRDAWCPVHVVLSNEGPDIEGELHIIYAYTTTPDRPSVAKPVSLPAHSRKAYFLYLPPVGGSTAWKVRLVSNGEVLVEERLSLRTMGGRDPLYGVVGGSEGSLNFLADVAPPGATGRVAYLPLEALPPDPLAWEPMDVLVLSDVDTGGLSPNQRRALETWVAHGGHLVVAGGGGADRTAVGVADLLPVTVGPLRSVEDLGALTERLGTGLVPGPYGVTEVTVREGEVLLEQDGLPLIVRRVYSAGVVDFVAFGTGAGLFTRWEDGTRLWSLLVETTAQPAPRIAFRQEYLAMEAIGIIPDLVAPSPFHLLAFVLVYTLLIGPVNYLVLKRLDRRELAWATIPLLVLAFTAFTYLTGLHVRGRIPIVHRLVAIRVPPGSDVGRATAAVGLFSPRRTAYDVQIAASVYPADWDFPGYGVPSAHLSRILQTGEGSRVIRVQVDVGGIRPFLAETYVDAPRVAADLRLVAGEGGDFRLEGTIRNGPSRLSEAVLIVGQQDLRLGDLEPGAETTVHLDLHGSVQTTPIGPSAFIAPPAPPYGWSDLPNRILGGGEYWTDRDLYRKYQFLSALFSNSPGLGPGVHLVGWAEEGPPEVEVVDRPSRQWTTALYIYDLPITLPETGVSFRIPPDLIFCAPEETLSEPYLGPHQSVVFRCTPGTAVRATRVTKVTVSLYGDGEVEVFVWDWEEERWIEVGSGWKRFTLPRPEAVTSSSGVIRLRMRTGNVPTGIERIEVEIEGER